MASALEEFVVFKNYSAILSRVGSTKSLDSNKGKSETIIHYGLREEFNSLSSAQDPHAEAMPLSLIEPILDFGQPHEKSTVALPPEGLVPGIEALGIRNCHYTGRGVTVAVLDTGINHRHEAFSDFKIVNGFNSLIEVPQIQVKNFTDELLDDLDGHGTHCAGILCGRPFARRVIGVAEGVDRLLIGKVIGKGGTSVRLIKAIEWAVEQGAQIISLSLSFDFCNIRDRLTAEYTDERAGTSKALAIYRQNIDFFERYIEYLNIRLGRNRPHIFAAVGNTSRRPSYALDRLSPAAARGVVAIGASNGAGVAAFSNENPILVGPGFAVWSADSKGINGLRRMNGTSMASPHVAGLAALYWQRGTKELPKIYGSNAPAIADRVLDELRRSAQDQREVRFPKASSFDVGCGEPIAPRQRHS